MDPEGIALQAPRSAPASSLHQAESPPLPLFATLMHFQGALTSTMVEPGGNSSSPPTACTDTSRRRPTPRVKGPRPSASTPDWPRCWMAYRRRPGEVSLFQGVMRSLQRPWNDTCEAGGVEG
jgi:hypothetical protein